MTDEGVRRGCRPLSGSGPPLARGCEHTTEEQQQQLKQLKHLKQQQQQQQQPKHEPKP